MSHDCIISYNIYFFSSLISSEGILTTYNLCYELYSNITNNSNSKSCTFYFKRCIFWFLKLVFFSNVYDKIQIQWFSSNSIPNLQVLVLTYSFSWKDTSLLETSWFQVWSRENAYESGTACYVWKEESIQTLWLHVQRVQNQLWRVPKGHIWDNLRIKK